MSNQVGVDQQGEPIYAWELPAAELAKLWLPHVMRDLGQITDETTISVVEFGRAFELARIQEARRRGDHDYYGKQSTTTSQDGGPHGS